MEPSGTAPESTDTILNRTSRSFCFAGWTVKPVLPYCGPTVQFSVERIIENPALGFYTSAISSTSPRANSFEANTLLSDIVPRSKGRSLRRPAASSETFHNPYRIYVSPYFNASGPTARWDLNPRLSPSTGDPLTRLRYAQSATADSSSEKNRTSDFTL